MAIEQLVAKYDQVKSSGKIKSYTEEETKKDFILPLFSALGWDTENKENKKEVSAEEHIISAGRVDYGFYLNDRVKFYVEAKSLKADLNDPLFAKQAIRYSWNRGVTWAVLTDFESLKIFNTQNAKSSLADKLLFEIPYGEYLTRFDQLWLLSRSACEQNLVDKYAEDHGKKLQKISVTASLYEDLNQCRQLLFESLSKWNEKISPDLIDEGVQKILDRLIFIRVAEDRGIEKPILIPLVREWEAAKRKFPLYQSMIAKFHELDDIYDSNLFSSHPSDNWEDQHDSVKKVIEILFGESGYYEYDFKIMPADVLGTVYENYLAHRLSKSKKGITLDKDAKKRKEQGIYYTPSFIVDYIVKSALKPVLDKCQSVADLKKIKVLDPACGSGSFLIKALEVIADKYKEMGNAGGALNKLQILNENIYGVDLDSQAVEIARLNLLVGALDERMKLQPLDKNIREGNSLTMNWQEKFPEVFAQGGFDVIIGNPPYIKEFVNKGVFDDLHNNPYYQGKMDIWTMFGCVSIDLLKQDGFVSFIAPNNWVSNAGASIMREKVLCEVEIVDYVDFGDYKVFEDAGIQTMIYVFTKRAPRKEYPVRYLRVTNKDIPEDILVSALHANRSQTMIEPEKLLGKNITFTGEEAGSIFEKIESKRNFELTEKEVAQGIVADPDKAFIFTSHEGLSKIEVSLLKNYFTSVGRYCTGDPRGFIAYLSKGGDYEIDKLPNIKNQLDDFKVELENRREVKNDRINWFNLHWPRDEKFFSSGPKIIGGIRVKYPSFFYTEDRYYGSRALNFIKTDRINLKYLTAILNSRLLFFWLKNKGKQLGDLLQVDKGPLLNIPICVGNKEQQGKIISLVDQMLDLHKKLFESPKDSNEWHKLKEEIELTDKKIDAEVYKLYDLTEEEIKIVEGF